MRFGERLSLCLLNFLRSKNALKQVKVLYFWNWQRNLRSWKAWKGHGKSHGKSWNLKSSKEYEPYSLILSIYLLSLRFTLSLLSTEGVQLLCLIDKGLDACRYLQTYGEWDRAAWLAKVTSWSPLQCFLHYFNASIGTLSASLRSDNITKMRHNCLKFIY